MPRLSDAERKRKQRKDPAKRKLMQEREVYRKRLKRWSSEDGVERLTALEAVLNNPDRSVKCPGVAAHQDEVLIYFHLLMDGIERLRQTFPPPSPQPLQIIPMQVVLQTIMHRPLSNTGFTGTIDCTYYRRVAPPPAASAGAAREVVAEAVAQEGAQLPFVIMPVDRQLPASIKVNGEDVECPLGTLLVCGSNVSLAVKRDTGALVYARLHPPGPGELKASSSVDIDVESGDGDLDTSSPEAGAEGEGVASAAESATSVDPSTGPTQSKQV